MSQDVLLHIFALLLIVGVTIVAVIDASAELNHKLGLHLKWTLLWYGARYVSIICGILLALDTIFGKC